MNICKKVTLVAAVATAATQPAIAQTATEGSNRLSESSEQAFASYIANMRGECASFENGELDVDTLQLEANVDFDGDGLADAMFDSAGLACSTVASFSGGTGGTTLNIFLSSGGKRIQYQQRDHLVVHWHGVPVLLLFLHGSACNRYGYQTCTSALTYVDGGFATVTPE